MRSKLFMIRMLTFLFPIGFALLPLHIPFWITALVIAVGVFFQDVLFRKAIRGKEVFADSDRKTQMIMNPLFRADRFAGNLFALGGISFIVLFLSDHHPIGNGILIASLFVHHFYHSRVLYVFALFVEKKKTNTANGQS